MGEPIVFLPGMMCDARLFGPQAAAFSGAHVIHHAPITGADTIAALAEEVLANAPPRFALAGLSMGGIVAMEILRIAPGRVARLALLDTNHLAETADRAAARGPQMAAARSGRLEAIMRDEMKPNYLADGPRRGEILDLVMAMALGLGPEVFVRQSRALESRPDQTETLKAAAVPTLVLCGRGDALCPVSRHERIAALIPGSELRIIEGAGHMPTLEAPAETTAALADWLARAPRG